MAEIEDFLEYVGARLPKNDVLQAILGLFGGASNLLNCNKCRITHIMRRIDTRNFS